jgi:hypothetical protein
MSRNFRNLIRFRRPVRPAPFLRGRANIEPRKADHRKLRGKRGCRAVTGNRGHAKRISTVRRTRKVLPQLADSGVFRMVRRETAGAATILFVEDSSVLLNKKLTLKEDRPVKQ